MSYAPAIPLGGSLLDDAAAALRAVWGTARTAAPAVGGRALGLLNVASGTAGILLMDLIFPAPLNSGEDEYLARLRAQQAAQSRPSNQSPYNQAGANAGSGISGVQTPAASAPYTGTYTPAQPATGTAFLPYGYELTAQQLFGSRATMFEARIVGTTVLNGATETVYNHNGRDFFSTSDALYVRAPSGRFEPVRRLEAVYINQAYRGAVTPGGDGTVTAVELTRAELDGNPVTVYRASDGTVFAQDYMDHTYVAATDGNFYRADLPLALQALVATEYGLQLRSAWSAGAAQLNGENGISFGLPGGTDVWASTASQTVMIRTFLTSNYINFADVRRRLALSEGTPVQILGAATLHGESGVKFRTVGREFWINETTGTLERKEADGQFHPIVTAGGRVVSDTPGQQPTQEEIDRMRWPGGNPNQGARQVELPSHTGTPAGSLPDFDPNPPPFPGTDTGSAEVPDRLPGFGEGLAPPNVMDNVFIFPPIYEIPVNRGLDQVIPDGQLAGVDGGELSHAVTANGNISDTELWEQYPAVNPAHPAASSTTESIKEMIVHGELVPIARGSAADLAAAVGAGAFANGDYVLIGDTAGGAGNTAVPIRIQGTTVTGADAQGTAWDHALLGSGTAILLANHFAGEAPARLTVLAGGIPSNQKALDLINSLAAINPGRVIVNDLLSESGANERTRQFLEQIPADVRTAFGVPTSDLGRLSNTDFLFVAPDMQFFLVIPETLQAVLGPGSVAIIRTEMEVGGVVDQLRDLGFEVEASGQRIPKTTPVTLLGQELVFDSAYFAHQIYQIIVRLPAELNDGRAVRGVFLAGGSGALPEAPAEVLAEVRAEVNQMAAEAAAFSGLMSDADIQRLTEQKLRERGYSLPGTGGTQAAPAPAVSPGGVLPVAPANVLEQVQREVRIEIREAAATGYAMNAQEQRRVLEGKLAELGYSAPPVEQPRVDARTQALLDQFADLLGRVGNPANEDASSYRQVTSPAIERALQNVDSRYVADIVAAAAQVPGHSGACELVRPPTLGELREITAQTQREILVFRYQGKEYLVFGLRDSVGSRVAFPEGARVWVHTHPNAGAVPSAGDQFTIHNLGMFRSMVVTSEGEIYIYDEAAPPQP
ncbi:MAG: hypothetical protein R3B70_15750 [Polyangiaceae bacterium]